MDLPEELKPDLHRTLLGPLSLASEIFGALLPGCVFVILVSLKRGLISPALSYPLLGYKTKIALGLFSSYIAGKIALSVVTLIIQLAKWIAGKLERIKGKTAAEEKPQNLLQLLAGLASQYLEMEGFQQFIAGLVAGPVVSNNSPLFQHYSAVEAACLFHLNAGFVFLVAAALPGDGMFRLLEAVAGIILVVRGITLEIESRKMVAGMLGATLNTYLSGLQPGQLSATLKSGWSVLSVLTKTPVPSAQPTVSTPKPAQNSVPPPVKQDETSVAPSSSATEPGHSPVASS